MEKQDCFLLGTIFKLHGYKGDVNIYNDNDIPLVYTDIEFLYIEDNNELIPYFAESVRPKKKQVLLVKLEYVDSEEQALEILKQKVYLPNKFLPEMGNVNPHKLIVGFEVIDNKLGKIGKVDFVNDKTAQKLIIVKDGSKELFIPFHEHFIKEIDTKNHKIIVEIPEELMNLN